MGKVWAISSHRKCGLLVQKEKEKGGRSWGEKREAQGQSSTGCQLPCIALLFSPLSIGPLAGRWPLACTMASFGTARLFSNVIDC